MPAYKDQAKGTWYASFYYENWKGEKEKKLKRGFKTKREALEWERTFQQQKASNLDMVFRSFVEVYSKDMEVRLKQNTWLTKKHIIETKLLPAFGGKKMNDIRPSDIIQWQNEMIAYRDEKGKPYSETYLKTLHNQLSAIFNHAVRFYELKANPAAKAGARRQGKPPARGAGASAKGMLRQKSPLAAGRLPEGFSVICAKNKITSKSLQ